MKPRFFIAPDTLLTCGHVIGGFSDIFLGGDPIGIFKVKEMILSDQVDVAVLRLHLPYGKECVYIPLSNTDFQEGEKVAFTGYPTLNAGIDTRETQICARDGGVGVYTLQGSIGTGFSGGPVIKKGKMGGIVNAHDPANNSAYMIPLSSFRDFLMEKVPDFTRPGGATGGKTTGSASFASGAFDSKVVEHLAQELEANLHLHWAFSLAWAKTHSYPGLEQGDCAPAVEIAEALLVSLSNYEAARLVNLADLWLVAYEKTEKDATAAMKALAKREPSTGKLRRFDTAEKLVDLIFPLLSARVDTGDASCDVGCENHEVTLNTPDGNVVEPLSSVWDERPPAYDALKYNFAPLTSKFQVPKPPPGGLVPDRDLKAEKVANDLLDLLLQGGQVEQREDRNINDSTWRELEHLLRHIMLRDERDKRGRYFIVFENQAEFEKCSGIVSFLKQKLHWLRFFILTDKTLSFDEQFLPLRDIVFRHQQTTVKHQMSEPSSGPSNPEERD